MENSNITIESNGIEQEPALESTEAGDFKGMQATYSPDDNKLRIYSAARLDGETFARVKAAGFRWAPKGGFFVAPMWTPQREDLAIELCGDVGDEDKSLVERAEERAERFEDYSDKRTAEAVQARTAVAKLADGIPAGQPILVGHHSERRARKDVERLENGMRRAVKLWDTASYWTARAQGAIRHASYKERPDVRARRIRGIEADLRKAQRSHDEASKQVKAWSFEGMSLALALRIANCGHVSASFSLADYPREAPASQYEGPMSLWSALNDGIVTPEQARTLALNSYAVSQAWAARWIAHYTLRLTYERAMLDEQGGTVADKTGPQIGGAVRCWASPHYGRGWSFIKKVNKVSVTISEAAAYGGRIFTRTMPFDKLEAIMTAAEVTAARDSGRLHELDDGTGFMLTPPPSVDADTDESTTAPPAPPAESAEEVPNAAQDMEALRDQLRQGVTLVVAPQLFPTPVAVAERMAELANIEPGHSVLEPSAGTGALLDAVRRKEPAAVLHGVEINAALVSRLQGQQYDVICADFLQCGSALGRFDRVLLNPPFEGAADILHVLHARQKLKAGGVLVAICADGPRQNTQLRPLVDACGGLWERLPADTFKQQGTGVRTVLLTLHAF